MLIINNNNTNFFISLFFLELDELLNKKNGYASNFNDVYNK